MEEVVEGGDMLVVFSDYWWELGHHLDYWVGKTRFEGCFGGFTGYFVGLFWVLAIGFMLMVSMFMLVIILLFLVNLINLVNFCGYLFDFYFFLDDIFGWLLSYFINSDDLLYWFWLFYFGDSQPKIINSIDGGWFILYFLLYLIMFLLSGLLLHVILFIFHCFPFCLFLPLSLLLSLLSFPLQLIDNHNHLINLFRLLLLLSPYLCLEFTQW